MTSFIPDERGRLNIVNESYKNNLVNEKQLSKHIGVWWRGDYFAQWGKYHLWAIWEVELYLHGYSNVQWYQMVIALLK